MHYHLVIPHSIWPDADMQAAIVKQLNLPALATLLGKGRRSHPAAQPWSSWLEQEFGGAAVAPLTLALDMPDAPAGFWLRADPVHLHVGRDQLSLQDARTMVITQDDATALVTALNGLFKADGWTFYAPHPERWYLHLAQDPQLRFTPLDEVIGLNIDPFLPRGPDAMLWHRALNELQMLLYTHPVNDAREALSKLSINSVWLWGGGVFPMPGLPQKDAGTVLANNEVVQGLARASGSQTRALPARADALPPQDARVVLDPLSAAVRANDAQAWYAAWHQLESDWFVPLLAGIKSGVIDRVTLTLPEAGLVSTADRSVRWRFWQPNRLPWSR